MAAVDGGDVHAARLPFSLLQLYEKERIATRKKKKKKRIRKKRNMEEKEAGRGE